MQPSTPVHFPSSQKKIHIILRLFLVFSMLGSLILSACKPKSPQEYEAEELADIQHGYLAGELGSQVVDLFQLDDLAPAVASQLGAGDIYPSPYLLYGAFSLDAKWYTNRVKVIDLPSDPVNLKAALGHSGSGYNADDLKVIYYPGDELILNNGAMVKYQVNDQVEVIECLNNPSQYLRGDDECGIYLHNQSETKKVYALERDQFGISSDVDYDKNRFSPNSYSGTIIYAKRIVLTDYISTGGYDLVLVADEIEAWPSATISTSPPDRPHDFADSGNAHDYGRGGPGYDAGDVVLLARRITGRIDLTTSGGRGQKGTDETELTCVEKCVACKIDNNSYIPQVLSDCQPCPLSSDILIEPPGWVIDVGYSCSGEAGVGGRGGDAGQVTLIGTDMPIVVDRLKQVRGGPGPNGDNLGPKPYGPDVFVGNPGMNAPEIEEAIAEEESHGHGWIHYCHQQRLSIFAKNCSYESVVPDNLPFECEECSDGYYCDFYDYSDHYKEYEDNIWDWCIQYGSRESGLMFFYCPLNLTQACPEPAGIVHRHCQLSSDQSDLYDCVEYPKEFYYVNSVKGSFGQEGSIAWYSVDIPIMTKPLSDGIADLESSFEEASLNSPSGAGDWVRDLTNLDYLQAVFAFAPRSADLLLLKGEYLYRSLSDSDLKNGDSLYENNSDINPNGENRILKAQYYFDSVMSLAPEAVDHVLSGLSRDLDSISPENPFESQIRLAYSLKKALLGGRNYFGFYPDFYFYSRPTEIRPFLDAVELISMDSVETYQAARNNVAALQTGYNNAVISMDLDFGYEAYIYESELPLVRQKLRFLTSRLDRTLQLIEENSQAITDTLGEEVGAVECLACIEDPEDPDRDCLPATIATEVELLELCSEQKPCDVQCWIDRVVTFAKLIVSTVKFIYGIAQEDWSAVFENLGSALSEVQEIGQDFETFQDAVDVIGEYADLLTNSEEVEILKKTVEDIVDIAEDVSAIADGVSDMQLSGSNQVVEEIASIVVNADEVSQGLQHNLTEIYYVQAELDLNRDDIGYYAWSMAHANTLEDLIKQNQIRNEAIPDLQYEHIIAAQEFDLAQTEWDLLNSRLAVVNSTQAFLNRISENFSQALAQAQVELDVAVRQANLLQDRLRLLDYFYTRSRDFLYLNPPSDFDFSISYLLEENAQDRQLENADDIITDFLDSIKTNEDGFVFDTISPARYSIQYSGDPFNSQAVVSIRSDQELQLALCPEYNPGGLLRSRSCSLTRAAYHDRIINQLIEKGSASFELYPVSQPSFRELSDQEKLEWNWSFSSADFAYTNEGFENQPAYKKRVVDVGSIFIMDGSYTYPDSVFPSIHISHSPTATFLIGNEDREEYFFPSAVMQEACRNARNLLDTNQFSCNGFEYFYKIEQRPPIDVGSLNPGSFSTYHMFGTSLRDTWTIDIEEFLSQMSVAEREEFWEAFRGLQFWVYYVSLQ